jgi:hypothetical protein
LLTLPMESQITENPETFAPHRVSQSVWSACQNQVFCEPL